MYDFNIIYTPRNVSQKIYNIVIGRNYSIAYNDIFDVNKKMLVQYDLW